MRRLIAWVLLILPLAACGNKGPLVRPGTPVAHRPVVSSPVSRGSGHPTRAGSTIPVRQP